MLHNQAAAASIGKPIATLNRSIHGPGLGRIFSHAGCQLNTRYGADRPVPTTSRINIVRMGLLRANAKPIAAPRKGAEQEVARTVASRPLKNAPAAPCFEAKPVAVVRTPDPGVTSNTPNKFSAISVTNVVIPRRKYGLPN